MARVFTNWEQITIAARDGGPDPRQSPPGVLIQQAKERTCRRRMSSVHKKATDKNVSTTRRWSTKGTGLGVAIVVETATDFPPEVANWSYFNKHGGSLGTREPRVRLITNVF